MSYASAAYAPTLADRASRSSTHELDLYFKEIAREPLLSATEEADLAARIQSGDQDAYRRLVETNLRLVVSIAKRQRVPPSVSLADVIAIGNFGLLEAAKKFDPQKGRFSTYATWWIRQAIGRWVPHFYRGVHLPVHFEELVVKAKKAREQLLLFNGEEPTERELAEHLSWDLDQVREVLFWTQDVVSLDLPYGQDSSKDGQGTQTLVEHLEQTQVLPPEPSYLRQENREQARKLLALLVEDPREEYILRMRNGINEEEREYSLLDIGSELKLSRERVRQLEERALQRIRQAVGVPTPPKKKKSA